MRLRASRTVSFALGLLAGLAMSACSGPRPARGIVIVTLDTTRADRIGCYGYAGAETPSLDRLASLGIRFDQAVSPVPITLPAHASIFTGEYPAVHGVRYNGLFRLPDSAVTLAEKLRDAGWKTAALPAAFPVTAATGLSQGFETYVDPFSQPGAGEESER